MIRVVVGTNQQIKRDENATIFDSTNFSIDAVREAIETPSLFGESKQIILLYLLETHHDILLSFFKEDETIARILSKESSNIVHDLVVRERELSSADEKFFTNLGVSIVGTTKVAKPVPEFSIWSLTDAILARDKKKAWLLFHEAIASGAAPEELSGMVWWQIKTMLQVLREGNPHGMKPFVISKTKRGLGNYSSAELQKVAQSLIAAIHEPRTGNGKAAEALEAWMLSL